MLILTSRLAILRFRMLRHKRPIAIFTRPKRLIIVRYHKPNTQFMEFLLFKYKFFTYRRKNQLCFSFSSSTILKNTLCSISGTPSACRFFKASYIPYGFLKSSYPQYPARCGLSSFLTKYGGKRLRLEVLVICEPIH